MNEETLNKIKWWIRLNDWDEGSYYFIDSKKLEEYLETLVIKTETLNNK